MSRYSSFCIKWQVSLNTRRSSVAAFNEFLSCIRLNVQKLRLPANVHVLLGNEAADADSIVSSLTYAFIHTQLQPETLCVPVIPIYRNELILRCDVTALFQTLEVNTDALVFVDEFPWDIIKSKVKVTLLDHNALSNKKIPALKGMQVVEIIDHHCDLGQHIDAEKREIAFADGNALVASTCTLVAERLKEVVYHNAHRMLSTMLLGVIALDSINFDPGAKKVTPRDVKAAQNLEETAFAKKEELFKWLQQEKFNPVHWDSFTLENCLQVDYKEFTFAKKKLVVYCKQNDLAFLVVMTMFRTSHGKRHRQLLFFQEIGDDAQHCVAFLKRGSSTSDDGSSKHAFYLPGHTSIPRKSERLYRDRLFVFGKNVIAGRTSKRSLKS
ncbi:unnamed protein product [Peronospora belbahrii]|uniref:DDH domain-containing protein n=1 Tax=Peronospora belbahrii TaxID=622444 RepID=A0ABN8D4I5_9STRA|nr:unnamed protein product [Peronospora belbahrii]